MLIPQGSIRLNRYIEVKLKIQTYVSANVPSEHTHPRRLWNVITRLALIVQRMPSIYRGNVWAEQQRENENERESRKEVGSLFPGRIKPIDFHCNSKAQATHLCNCGSGIFWIARTAKGEPIEREIGRESPSLPPQRSCGFSCSPFHLEARVTENDPRDRTLFAIFFPPLFSLLFSSLFLSLFFFRPTTRSILFLCSRRAPFCWKLERSVGGWVKFVRQSTGKLEEVETRSFVKSLFSQVFCRTVARSSQGRKFKVRSGRKGRIIKDFIKRSSSFAVQRYVHRYVLNRNLGRLDLKVTTYLFVLFIHILYVDSM